MDDDGSSHWTTATRPVTADLITSYGRSVRDKLGTATASACSYAGLWLLLARLAPVACGAHRGSLAETIGVPCDDAAVLAAELLSAPHPTIAAALGAWSRSPVTAALPVALDDLPGQAGLDRWAGEHTRGLVDRFPLTIDADTLLVFATALVLQPRWTTELGIDDNGLLLLEGGLQTVVDTRAAGRVGVAKPFSADGVDVVSVIAAPQYSPVQVWHAADEVIGRLNTGALWNGELPGRDVTDGHCWTVRRSTETFVGWGEPDDDRVLWRSHLPRWSANADTVLTEAPGLADIVASLGESASELAGPSTCVQSATVAYDETGFSAAAVTAMAQRTGMPELAEHSVFRVEMTFDRPHAVVAVARGGPWEGAPIFHAWVTPD